MTVCSQVLSFALRDFNARHDIRTQSKGMFRNFTRTLVELYPVYRWIIMVKNHIEYFSRKIDKCLSACLIEPLFRCLQMLVDEDPDDRDLHVIQSLNCPTIHSHSVPCPFNRGLGPAIESVEFHGMRSACAFLPALALLKSGARWGGNEETPHECEFYYKRV